MTDRKTSYGPHQPGNLLFFRTSSLLLLSLLLIQPLSANIVIFRLNMSHPAACALFDSTDQVEVRGTFSGWNTGLNLAREAPESSIFRAVADVPAGWNEYKFVIHHSDNSLHWETGNNRSLWTTADTLNLPLAWFDRDSSAVLQPANQQIHFQVDLTPLIHSGEFDPAVDAVEVRGNHWILGNWTNSGPTMAAEGASVYGIWQLFPGLSNCELQWKFVVRNPQGAIRWEYGADRSWTRQGDEPDLWPLPTGDGIADQELDVACFDHASCAEVPSGAGSLLHGADLSFVAQLESLGTQWRLGGVPRDPLEIFAGQGWSIQRLRIWHSPSEPWHGLQATLEQALRGQAAGMQLLLDFHYSDTWADPGQQAIPLAWQGLDLAQMADSLYAYTAFVMQQFFLAGVPPQWVQLGNEIDGGLLWPMGQTTGTYDTPQQWQNLGTLLSAAAQGAIQGIPAEQRPQRILHLAQGANNSSCQYFLDHMTTVPFEIIGLSYYPWWHGDLGAVHHNLQMLAAQNVQDLMIVECNYPWTLQWQDNTNNFVGLPEQLLANYPASPAGQLAFFRSLEGLLRAVPDSRGKALCLWEPEWITAAGLGNPQENLALFDFSGEALPAFALPAPQSPDVQIQWLPGHSLQLCWDPVPGALNYRIETRQTPSSNWVYLAETSTPCWTTSPPTQRAFFRIIAESAP